ncbi:serpin family protein [Oscillospiraceae bacterium HV4-5-C5C]|nr:serpin family protein [Oscillospiraceae bacterium HV4-5-C5C]
MQQNDLPRKRSWIKRATALLTLSLAVLPMTACGSSGSVTDESRAADQSEPTPLAAVAAAVKTDDSNREELLNYGLEGEAAQLAQALRRFDQNSLPQLSADGSKNIIYSPASLFIDLAMLTEGAQGETRTQLLTLLYGETENASSLAQEMTGLLQSLNLDDEATGLTLRSAQSAWVDQAVTVKQSFADLAAQRYQTAFYNYTSQSAAHQALAQWIEEHTLKLITADSVGADLPSPDSLMTLVNALYFKGAWTTPFDGTQNVDGTFTAADGSQSEAVFMNRQAVDSAASVTGLYQMADLTLAGGYRLRLTLPAENVSLTQVLNSDEYWSDLAVTDTATAADEASDETQSWQRYNINWSVPKIDLSGELDLTDILPALGATLAVQPGQADFSGLLETAGNGDLVVGDIKQLARLKMNEDGVEAAAATLIGIRATSLPVDQPELDMVLDRPFLAELQTPAGIPLFSCVIALPAV